VNSIRQYIYAALLALTTLTFAPSLALGQTSAHGKFTLAHDVHWENVVVPAGNYRFSLESDNVLRLDKVSGSRAGFMFLVHGEQSSTASDISRILLEETPAGRYVSAMQLPEFGMTLNFTVPLAAEKPMARAATVHSTSGQ
jgi:hypothetical protein